MDEALANEDVFAATLRGGYWGLMMASQAMTYSMIYEWLMDEFNQANAAASLPYADELFCVTNFELLLLTVLLNMRWADDGC